MSQKVAPKHTWEWDGHQAPPQHTSFVCGNCLATLFVHTYCRPLTAQERENEESGEEFYDCETLDVESAPGRADYTPPGERPECAEGPVYEERFGGPGA